MKDMQLQFRKLGAAQEFFSLPVDAALLAVQNGSIDETDWCRELGQDQWRSVGDHPALCTYVPDAKNTTDFAATDKSMSLTPLSDIAFLLLIYFLVNFSVVTLQSMSIPKSTDARQSKEQEEQDSSFGGRAMPEPFRLILRVDVQGRFSIDGVAETPKQYDATTLRELLQSAAKMTGAEEVVIVHAPDTRYEHVVAAFDAGAGVKELRISWEKETETDILRQTRR